MYFRVSPVISRHGVAPQGWPLRTQIWFIFTPCCWLKAVHRNDLCPELQVQILLGSLWGGTPGCHHSWTLVAHQGSPCSLATSCPCCSDGWTGACPCPQELGGCLLTCRTGSSVAPGSGILAFLSRLTTSTVCSRSFCPAHCVSPPLPLCFCAP